MRILAYLTITISLVAGSIAAITAYVPRVDRVRGMGLTLNADAGRNPTAPGEPLVSPRESDQPIMLSDTLIVRLTEAGVERVRVREFSFSRWDHRWVFALAAFGMLVGGLVIRRLERTELAERMTKERREAETPEFALRAIHSDVAALLAELQSVGTKDATSELIRHRIDWLHETHILAFVSARRELVARFGIGGFARIMDPFAAAERQINRAWSAATDEDFEEARASLQSAVELLDEVIRRSA